MTIDERLNALLKATENLHASIQELRAITHEQTLQLQADADNICRLARIASIHEARLSRLEAQPDDKG